MWRALLRVLLFGLLTLLLVSVVVFVCTQVLPGDPVRAILGHDATPERVAALSKQLHLDKPMINQYFEWLRGIVTGNLGNSTASGGPVTDVIGSGLANSVFLVLVAGLVGVPLSLVVGVLMAVRRDRPTDHLLSLGTLALAALPEFVIAMALAFVFATNVIPILPAVAIIPGDERAWQHLGAVVLPAAALVLSILPYISRIMRGSMIEVLESEYVTMARLKGLPERTVIWFHAVPNAIVPSIQVTALCLAWMAGGVVVIEYVFAYPGIGQALVQGVANRDVPVVQALVLFIAALYVVLNRLADLATFALTPRLRAGPRS